MELYLNDTLVSAPHNYRHVMAHLGRYLSLNKDCFNTFLDTELGYLDKGKGPDDTTSSNTGFIKRKSIFVEEGGAAPKVPLLSVLTHDLSSLKNLIIPNVDLKFKLFKNPSKVIKAPRVESYLQWDHLFNKKFHFFFSDFSSPTRQPRPTPPGLWTRRSSTFSFTPATC